MPADGPDGMRCTNFITLAGGILQSFLFGYAGVRQRQHQMDIDPYLLPNTTEWGVSGLNYRGWVVNLNITDEVVQISAERGTPDQLILYDTLTCERLPLEVGERVEIDRIRSIFVLESEEDFADLGDCGIMVY